jgi:hypothetical protein
MAIPFSTTTITIRRPSSEPPEGEDYVDPLDAPGTPTVVASAVRAHISSPSGTENQTGGTQTVDQYRLDCDIFAGELRHTDEIVDDTTGLSFRVLWAMPRIGMGLDHIEAGLLRVEGLP